MRGGLVDDDGREPEDGEPEAPQEITLTGGLTLPPLGVLFQRTEAPGGN